MIDLQTIQRLALVAVETGNWDYTYRKICRWYSTTFSTPLHYVELDMLPEDVLQHYFEHTIEKLKEKADDLDAKADVIETWDKFRSAIIVGYQAAQDEEKAIEQEDDDWATDFAKILAKEEAAKDKQKQTVKPVNVEPNLYNAETIFGQETIEDELPPDY